MVQYAKDTWLAEWKSKFEDQVALGGKGVKSALASSKSTFERYSTPYSSMHDCGEQLMANTMITVSEALIAEALTKPVGEVKAEVASQLAKMSANKVGEIHHSLMVDICLQSKRSRGSRLCSRHRTPSTSNSTVRLVPRLD